MPPWGSSWYTVYGAVLFGIYVSNLRGGGFECAQFCVHQRVWHAIGLLLYPSVHGAVLYGAVESDVTNVVLL